MKPMNFPRRRAIRRANAELRANPASADTGINMDAIDALREVRTKKSRRDRAKLG